MAGSPEAGSSAEWGGAFNAEAYTAARHVLEEDRVRATGEVKKMTGRRGRTVGITAAVWAVCSVALAVANPDWLLIAEIGWAVIVACAVFFLYPAFTAQGNLDELFGQYAARLDQLEEAEVPLPAPSDMGDLVAALDLAKLPEDGER